MLRSLSEPIKMETKGLDIVASSSKSGKRGNYMSKPFYAIALS